MKTALVTGGAQRLGKGIVQMLAARGYAVAIHYNDSADDADALSADLNKDGHQTVCVQADLTKSADDETLVAEARAALDRPLTCLVNNAATFDHDHITTLTAQSWDSQMMVNLRAPALLCQAFAAQTKPPSTGVIINMLDQRIAKPGASFFSYGVSKSGLAAMTESLAIALAPQIRVCGVAPGLTLPSGHQTQDQFAEAQSKHLLGRGPDVRDIAEAVAYLADAEAVTGQILYVDGGERYRSGPDDSAIITPS